MQLYIYIYTGKKHFRRKERTFLADVFQINKNRFPHEIDYIMYSIPIIKHSLYKLGVQINHINGILLDSERQLKPNTQNQL